MENLDQITAEWARKTAKTQLGADAQKQVERALIKIAEEVKQNKMSANCFFNIDEIAKKELVSRGFNVEYIQGDSAREPGFNKISW